MNAERPLLRTARLALVVVLGAVALGCRGGSAPSAPAAASLSPDEQVLQTLDCYNPQYKLNEDGHVTHLNLGWRHLPASALAEIDKFTELEMLDLAGTTVTDDGLAQLKDLQKLRDLGLGDTPVTDRGLAHLEKLQGLQHLWVAKGRVSEAAVEKLKEARPDLIVYGFQ